MICMRTKISIFLIVALLASLTASAQSIAIADRAPKIKFKGCSAQKGEYIFLGFIHPSSEPCKNAMIAAADLVDKNSNLSMVIFTREHSTKPGWMRKISSPKVKIYTNASEVFKQYGVDYAPFGVILDHKRRILWYGNPQRLTQQRIKKIISQWSSQR